MSITRKRHKKGTEMTRKWHVNVIVYLKYYCYNLIQRGEIMTQKQLAEIIAAFKKLEIENNPNLTDYEKELLKSLIDEAKKKVK